MFRNQDLDKIEYSRDDHFSKFWSEYCLNWVHFTFPLPFAGGFLPPSLPIWIFLGNNFQAFKHKFVNQHLKLICNRANKAVSGGPH